MENVDSNTVIDETEEIEEYEFRYNFINTPWDDRTSKSKFGIIALLVSIFVGTMACVANSIAMQYRGFETRTRKHSDFNCQMVKMEEHGYAVRIHSVTTQEIVCVGALIGRNTVLANGACVKSGPILLKIGSPNDPQCKKGFKSDVQNRIYHDGVISKNIVLISSHDNLASCGNVIKIGQDIDINSHAYIIGRTLHGGRLLARQPVIVVEECSCSGMEAKNMKNKANIICVRNLARCPVLAGDLLVQNGKLYGLASTSVHKSDSNKLACFASLNHVYSQLKELVGDI